MEPGGPLWVSHTWHRAGHRPSRETTSPGTRRYGRAEFRMESRQNPAALDPPRPSACSKRHQSQPGRVLHPHNLPAAESLVLSQAWGRLLLDKPGLDCSSLARHTDGSCHRRLLARMVRPIMGAPALPAHQGGLQDALGSAKLSSPSTCSGNLVHIVCGR